MKLRALMLAGLCIASGQSHAGLFNDDEARKQIQQVEARTFALEESSKQQADTNQRQAEFNKQQTETNRQQTETNRQQAETSKQQIRTLLDLQGQIEAQNTELRSLRGQNEELMHNLRDAEKRQKDFYIDLDTRIRHFESAEAAAAANAAAQQQPAASADNAPAAADDPALENRAYEAAYGIFKAGNHQKAITAFQEFLKKFPASVYAPNASYGLGNAYFALKDYKNALVNYQLFISNYSFSPKVPEAMLNVADCQQALENVSAARKTLKKIIAKYPGSEVSDEAKKRLAELK